MSSIFSFGETVPEYDIKVLNEREVRASAGILFMFAMISFLNSWLIGDFSITKTFVVFFLIDFSIRILINPKYSPTLILGRFFVRNQTVEYVGAPQKRVAWLIGLVLSIVMFYFIVLNDIIGPFNLLVCLICLTLLFFEAAFGICLGCKLYNVFNKEKAQLCPGNVCEVKDKKEIQKIKPVQFLLVAIFIGLIVASAQTSFIQKLSSHKTIVTANANAASSSGNEECVAPDWAVKIGHKEKWELHNCKKTTENEATSASVETATAINTSPSEEPSTPVVATSIPVEKVPESTTESNVKTEECVAPDWAVKMGHKEKWKLHNCK